jgi:RES domain
VIERNLPDDHVWLRITRPEYVDPFDMTFAQQHGGRWNPPNSWPTLYLNADMATVHAQVRHMFVGRAVDPDDLDDDAPIHLAAATLPNRQRVADVVSSEGVAAVGLGPAYPLDRNGNPEPHAVTQPIGVAVHEQGLRGVWCRSAAFVGEELAWFPARRAIPHPHWDQPRPFGAWRFAPTVNDVAQPENIS